MQTRWLGLCVLLVWGLSAQVYAAQNTEHVIISYDVSASMNAKYVGEGTVQAANAVVLWILSGNSGQPVSQKKIYEERSEDFAAKYRLPLFEEGKTRISAFTFGTMLHPKIVSEIASLQDIEAFIPSQFSEQDTEMSLALRYACLELFGKANEFRALWIHVSDGKDDPANSAKAPKDDDVHLRRQISLLYRASIAVPENLPPVPGDTEPTKEVVVRLYEITSKAAVGTSPSKVDITKDNASITIMWDQPRDPDTFMRVDRLDTASGVYEFVKKVPASEGKMVIPFKAGDDLKLVPVFDEHPGEAVHLNPVAPDKITALKRGPKTTVAWQNPRNADTLISVYKTNPVDKTLVALAQEVSSDAGAWETTDLHEKDYISLVAVKSGLRSKPSEPVQVAEQKPDAPTGLKASISGKQSTISWVAIDDPKKTLLLERAESPDGPWTELARQLSAKDGQWKTEKLQAGQYVRASAESDGAISSPSGPVVVVDNTPPEVAPAPPSEINVSYDSARKMAAIEWKTPKNDGITLDAEWSQDGQASQGLIGTGIVSVKGLWETDKVTPGQYIRLVTTQGGKKSEPSAWAKVPVSTAVVEEFRGTSASAPDSNGNVVISWQAPKGDQVAVDCKRLSDGKYVAKDIEASKGYCSTKELKSGEKIRLEAHLGPVNNTPVELEIPGGSVVWIALLIPLIALILYLMRKLLITGPIAFVLEDTERRLEPFPCSLMKKQRLVFSESAADDELAWPEPDAPSYALVNRGRSICLLEKDDSGEITKHIQHPPLRDGETFRIHDRDGDEYEIHFKLTNTSQAKPGESENLKEVADNDYN